MKLKPKRNKYGQFQRRWYRNFSLSWKSVPAMCLPFGVAFKYDSVVVAMGYRWMLYLHVLHKVLIIRRLK